MKAFLELIAPAVQAGASDMFLVAGQPLSYKQGPRLVSTQGERLMPGDTFEVIEEIYTMAGRDISRLKTTGDDDFALSVPGLSRLRVSTYRQRGSYAAVIRVIAFGIPDHRAMGIPEQVMQLARLQSGLVLITGAAGSGKSTTQACLIDRINHTRNAHIITLEDPIEFLHRNDKSIVSQREIGLDTRDYITALRACLRQAPDVILLGEMRDYETISVAMTAAETGHLVISTLHTQGAVSTIDRIIDIFSANQQHQIRVQLASLLRCVVSQQLLTGLEGQVLPVFEIMQVNNAVRNMIRESKTHQIDALIGGAAEEGMVSMDSGILALFRQDKISADTAVRCAIFPEQMARRVGTAERI